MSFWRDKQPDHRSGNRYRDNLGAMFVTGWNAFNHEALTAHHAPTISLVEYSRSGHFLSALFENWESEFLQMFAYVGLTAFLFQKGSAESNDPDHVKQHSEKTISSVANAMGLGQRIGAFVYSYSLGIVLAALFLASFGLHLVFSAEAARLEAERQGVAGSSLYGHLGDAEFWFESFQNWQSEFLSTMVLVVLTHLSALSWIARIQARISAKLANGFGLTVAEKGSQAPIPKLGQSLARDRATDRDFFLRLCAFLSSSRLRTRICCSSRCSIPTNVFWAALDVRINSSSLACMALALRV